MNRFLLFLIMWVVSMLLTFSLFQSSSQTDVTKYTLATLFGFILYHLVKDENEKP